MYINNRKQKKSVISILLMLMLLLVENTRLLAEPLTIEYALTLSNKLNPVLQRSLAEKQQILAEKLQTESTQGFNSSLEARLRWFEASSLSTLQSDTDHRFALTINKTLYDFGRYSFGIAATEKRFESHSYLYRELVNQRRVSIMQAYFSVLLADLQFVRENEDMAIAFIRWDNLRKQNKLGQVSELVVEQEFSVYQTVRRKRFESQNQQRQTRSRLAQQLMIHDLPETLAIPAMDNLTRPLPAVEELQQQALQNNLYLTSLRLQLDAANRSVNQARAGSRPILRGEASAFSYERNLPSRDKWNAGVVLEIPLTSGGYIDAKVAKARAKVYELKSEIQKTQMDIQHDVLTLWLELDTLRFKRDETRAFSDYSEIALEQKRALYELEVKATLGSAMVQTSEAQIRDTKSNLDTILNWARLNLLLGNTPGMDYTKTLKP